MNSKYITQSELIKRWSKNLVDFYYPFCSELRDNPKNKRYANMRLYDMDKVRRIESTAAFREDYKKLLERRQKRKKVQRT